MELSPAHQEAPDDVVTFGRFELSRARHVLLRDGEPVPVGSRAMAILVALTESAGTILSNRELLARAWPGTVVEEGTIRSQVAQLRRIFRGADPRADYVQNITGRGYRFAAPVLRRHRPGPSDAAVLEAPVGPSSRKQNLPPCLMPIIGRERNIGALVDRVPAQRLVTIVGPGGGGKTSVAVCVANALADTLPERWPHGVCFVDLASVADVRRVPVVLASTLGVARLAEDPLPDVLAYLSDRSLLLLMDNCEHVVDSAAQFAERVLGHAPQVHMLATSREPLRAAGESVYDLQALEVPPEQGTRTRSQLLEYSAIQLFVERAGAHAVAQISDDELPSVVEICRHLDGNPLAIEIVAAHVRLLGFRALTADPQDNMYLLISGRRTAEPRHRTLRATFDWSYALLSPVEQLVFRRMSVFPGSFDLDDAASALADESLTNATLFESLVNLVRKSLLVTDTTGEKVRYRLLDLPRAYACEKLREADQRMSRRHSPGIRNEPAAPGCRSGK